MDADALSQNRSAFVQRLTQATRLLIVLSAVALRIRGIGRPFWLDEAWVANSALASSLRDSFQYDTWLQTNPPMFVMAIRIAHKLFGGYEIPFRAVPFAFSVATVVLALHLGKRLFGPVFGLFLRAILAVSPILISLSLQLKQYS
jgi:predicted membrane-bound mannosyltransferase